MRKEIIILSVIVITIIAAAVIGSNYYIDSVQSVRKGTPAAPGSNSGNSSAPTASKGLLVRPESNAIGPEDWVLVHDAARPCLSRAALERLIEELDHDETGGLLRPVGQRAGVALSLAVAARPIAR